MCAEAACWESNASHLEHLVRGAAAGQAAHAAVAVASIDASKDEGDGAVAQGGGGADGRHPPDLFKVGQLRGAAGHVGGIKTPGGSACQQAGG